MNSARDWPGGRPSADGTHHLDAAGRALYAPRFDSVLPFHSPGLAPATLRGDAFHILPNGKRAYANSFSQTFGFYENLAAVAVNHKWFHIQPNGNAAYKNTWQWCGNFQQGRCAARDASGYFHIDARGMALPGGPYAYAGDFREGAAVVRAKDGLCRHINLRGQLLHDRAAFDLDVFHKGVARARDADGWFHLARDGSDASCGRRYQTLEPFYNGQALAKTPHGENVVIDQNGAIQVVITRSAEEYRAALHAVGVSPWRPLAMRLGVLLGLAGGESMINCPRQNLSIVIRAWIEIGLLDADKQLTPLGARLAPGKIERDRLLYWTGAQLTPWLQAEKRIQQNLTEDELQNFFTAHNAQTTSLIRRALASYANEDWRGIGDIIKLPPAAAVVDVGGGCGALLAQLTEHRGKKILVELPTNKPDALPPDVEFIGLDFFQNELPKGDVYLFSRVLHDWHDARATTILARLPDDACAIVIDREDEPYTQHGRRHGLLSLNMLLTCGARERTREEWRALFAAAGLRVQKRDEWRGHVVMYLARKKPAASFPQP